VREKNLSHMTKELCVITMIRLLLMWKRVTCYVFHSIEDYDAELRCKVREEELE
jgi:hypothetical protein